MGRRAVATLGRGVLVVGVLALTGCGLAQPGAAADSDAFQVTQAQVDDEIRAVLTQAGQPAGDPPEGLAAQTVQRLVQDQLILALATDMGVEATQGQIDEASAALEAQFGGAEQLAASAAQAGIPAGSIDDFLRSQVLVTKVAGKLTPGATGEAAQQATNAALVEFSESIDLQVAPRYGTWDTASLTIVPGSPVASLAQTGA